MGSAWGAQDLRWAARRVPANDPWLSECTCIVVAMFSVFLFLTWSQAGTEINAVAWELQGPPDVITAFKTYGEQVNTPRLGHWLNFFWGTMQTNIARPKHISEGERRFLCALRAPY